MRVDNLVLVAVCTAALVAAIALSRPGWRLPTAAPVAREPLPTAVALVDALRSVACALTAALVAGTLVVGLGGRLVMRVLAATSRDIVQGQLTEAEEAIGEITFGGTFFFVVFAGLVVPLFLAFPYLVVRRILPTTAWAAGLTYGLLALATVGVADPLSPDNVDFAILTPRWLAVILVLAVAALYGVVFAALDARLRAWTATVGDDPAAPRVRRAHVVYLSLGWLVIPVYLVPAVAYVGLRTVARGRVGAALDRPVLLGFGRASVGLVAAASLVIVGRAAAEII